MKRPLVIPPALKKGDVIGIVAPAGQIADRERFTKGIRILRDMGFEPKFPREMWPGAGYLADDDAARVAELHRMVADQEVRGLMAARGGYGCLRLLPSLDFSLLRDEPKIILGFSDISVLLNQLVARSGLLCFHGPVVTSLGGADGAALTRLVCCLKGEWRREIKPEGLEILRSGQADGHLLGGNLSSLVTLLGTPFACDWTGAILVLEDVNEPLYRVDRMLTQLALAGKLDGLKGLILGDFAPGAGREHGARLRHAEGIWQRALELTADSGIPVWGNFPAGHCPRNLTLPFGATAVMESGSGVLRLR